MAFVLVVVLLVLVIMTAIVVIGHRNRDASLVLDIEPIEEEQPLYWEDKISLDYFNMFYKVVEFREADGTTGVYVMDKKTHAIQAFALHSDGVLKMVKQVQGNK